MYSFKCFNLNWKSSELNFPEFENKGLIFNPDIEICKSEPKLWPEISSNQFNTNFLKLTSDDVRLNIQNIGKFRISNGNSISWYKDNKNIENNDIGTFILGTGIGTILIQRGILVLHANALEKDGKGIICLGNSGVGKSTIAYLLMQKGWKLISDDLVAVTPKGMILPGIPRIKLWQDVVELLDLDKNSLPRLRKKINKFLIKGEHIISSEKIVPLHKIYVINRSREFNSEKNIKISDINSQQISLLCLKKNYYRPRIVRGIGMEACYFKQTVNLLKSIPLLNLNLPNDLGLVINLMKNFDDYKLLNDSCNYKHF